MNEEYELKFIHDDYYKVVDEHGHTVCRGDLVKCNAWLQLNKNGYIS